MSAVSGSNDVVDSLLRSGCFLRGTFRLSSGGVSSYYVDVRRLYSHPSEARTVVLRMAELVRGLGCDVVAGVESGGVPLAAMVAFALGKPLVYVRKEPKKHGTRKLIEGDESVLGTAVVIDDVATTGSTLLRAVGVLRESGYSVRDAAVVVDREEGAAQSLAAAGVRLHALTTLRELVAASGGGGR